MNMPNYENGSIVNIMASIEASYGLNPPYGTYRGIDPSELSEYQSVVFMLIDGLGREYIDRFGGESFIARNLHSTATSVFPTTTSSAITSLATGVAPQQHAVTGWFMHLKEIGIVSQILPFNPRLGGMYYGDLGLDPSMFIDSGRLFDRVPADTYCIIKDDIISSPYSSFMAGGSKRYAYSDLDGYFSRIRECCAVEGEKKLIYAYWSHFDTLCHLYGVDNDITHEHFRAIDKELELLHEELSGSGTCLLVTADHGQLDVTDDTTIQASDHPGLYECLTLPICGESRAAFCYVRPSMTGRFERYVEEELDDYCTMLKGTEMISEGYFGLDAPNPKLFDRVGDYVLLMKDNFVIRDSLLGERKHVLKGYHGGLDDQELFVPLLKLG